MKSVGVEASRHGLDQLLDILPALRGETDDAEAAPGVRLGSDRELVGDQLCLGSRGGLDDDLYGNDPSP
jgi:hypothetical protein